MAKNTGIVRKLDQLGRIVIPKEIRDLHEIFTGDPVEFFIDGETLIVRGYKTQTCIFCGQADRLVFFKQQFVCASCIEETRRKTSRQYIEESAESKPAENTTEQPEKRRGRRSNTLQRLIEAVRHHPDASQKDLAQMLGVSQSRISQLMRSEDFHR